MIDVVSAHKLSSQHRSKLQLDDEIVCGCFYCCRLFHAGAIAQWVDPNPRCEGETALCPLCEIDSVIYEYPGFQISEEFLQAMRKYWFEI